LQEVLQSLAVTASLLRNPDYVTAVAAMDSTPLGEPVDDLAAYIAQLKANRAE